uniref:Uncharacterized protein n=1 Tax=Ixodes ricinus TaxID=34613 RepID=A0A6B0UJN2_IXORI
MWRYRVSFFDPMTGVVMCTQLGFVSTILFPKGLAVPPRLERFGHGWYICPYPSSHHEFRKGVPFGCRGIPMSKQCLVDVRRLLKQLLRRLYGPFHRPIALRIIWATCHMT